MTPSGIVVIATEGSRWEFLETEHLYRRSPLQEGPREIPEWGGPDAGPLQDHVWHEFRDWSVLTLEGHFRLHIVLPDYGQINAPRPDAEVDSRHQCAMCEVADS